MVIMALDHSRDFFHLQSATSDPTNMITTTPFLFFTRWITHFCAPVFVFLSGMAAYLAGQKKTTAELSRLLLTRGLWLIAVEILIVSLVLTFNPFYNFILLQVIWAIGISMVIMAALVFLPWKIILYGGLLIFFAHNLLDYPEAARKGNLNLFWSFVHGRNAVMPLNSSHIIFVAYSFLPWTGIMILGFCAGRLFDSGVTPATRKKWLTGLGFGLLVIFTVLRMANGYGDPFPWATQRSPAISLLSFLNVNKYPPSLLFCCITLGPALLLLASLEATQSRVRRFFEVYGRVPFFYFIGHFLLIHLLCIVLFFVQGYPLSQAYGPTVTFGFRPPAFGYPLAVVYLLWITVVCSMYPACKAYGRYKFNNRHWWLSYL
jgi:uncharacterized membrane protein